MNFKRASLFTVIAMYLVASEVLAQKPAKAPLISMNVDRKPLVVGQPFVLTIHIESSSSNDPDVSLPRFNGFRVLKQSESHPVSFSFSFGLGTGGKRHSKKESNYQFVLVADRPGRYKLNPVTVVLDGRRYKGDPFIIDILKSDGTVSRDPVPQNEPTPADEYGQAGIGGTPEDEALSDLEGAKFDKTYFIQTMLSREKAVIGQPIIMTVYLYTSVNIGGLEVAREPGTEGFWVENLLEGNRRFTTEPVRIGGREFGRGTLRKVVLYPIKTGKLTISPALVELQTRRGGFFSRPKTVKRAGLPVSVEVSKLPIADQPEGFNPANVGTYSFKASVDNTETKVGEPVILSLVVTGEGNIRNLELPVFDELDGFKVYAPESDSDVRIQGDRVRGTKTSKVLMIPNEEGAFEVPPIKWSYFDPKVSKYKILESLPLTITVGANRSVRAAPVAESNGVSPSVTGQDRLNRKLKSILSRSNLERNGVVQPLTRPWFMALMIIVPLAYLAVILVSRTRRRILEGNLKGRSKRAFGLAVAKLKTLGKDPNQGSAEDFFAEMSRTLSRFLEDRLETTIAGDTAVELKDRLISRGFSEEQTDMVVGELEACDFARFAGASRPDDRKQALSKMEQLIRELAETKVLLAKEGQ